MEYESNDTLGAGSYPEPNDVEENEIIVCLSVKAKITVFGDFNQENIQETVEYLKNNHELLDDIQEINYEDYEII